MYQQEEEDEQAGEGEDLCHPSAYNKETAAAVSLIISKRLCSLIISKRLCKISMKMVGESILDLCFIHNQTTMHVVYRIALGQRSSIPHEKA